MSDFSIHPRLQADCIYVGKLNLCHLMLLNNSHFGWFILIPEVSEEQVHLLSTSDRALLYAEVQHVSQAVDAVMSPKRINTGAIGNLVPQLHFHVVARHESDPAWPGVVWGSEHKKEYQGDESRSLIEEVKKHLQPLEKDTRSIDKVAF